MNQSFSLSSLTSPRAISLNSPFPRPTSRIPTPTSPTVSKPKGLLVPTDRTLEDFEEHWLPALGRLKVEKEVILHGYALYALRTWYLSRTHWTQTIVAQTGKPNEHVSMYLLLPDPELSERAGKAEIASAVQYLVGETHAQQRKTEHGILLVTTPSAFGQDVFPIPGGDLREMKPFLIVNTGLRRLGCGGRAAMGMDSPIPAVRRKFFELYHLPPSPSMTALSPSRSSSPTTSPRHDLSTLPSHTNPSVSPQTITADPFTQMVLEMVRLIQAALAIWGMIPADMELDGLFCDETKEGLFAWRKAMGMEHEDSMRLEKETSGGCIDPKTLATLLSSITSARYQLDALDVEKVPKDPLSSPKRFLTAWHIYQNAAHHDNPSKRAQYLTVSSIRHLNSHYLAERTRSPDALKVHRFLFSGVASATSSLHANLKGSGHEDTPLRKREHHLRNRLEDGSNDSGLALVVPPGEIGSFAPPDVMTSDLEAYTKGILKTREKDWDLMGVRRIAALWSGQADLRAGRTSRRHAGVLSRRRQSADTGDTTEEGGAKAAFGKMTTKTGQAIKDGLGFVSRRGAGEDTSESETGAHGGPGPSSLRSTLAKKKPNVPTVIEPMGEECEDRFGNSLTPSPSPGASRLHVDRALDASASRRSYLSATTSHGRPSIITSLSGEGSDYQSRRSDGNQSPSEERHEPHTRLVGGERSVARLNRERAPAMLRTSSDGADVLLEEGELEWEVINPHGTAKGREGVEKPERPLVRRHSLQDRMAYRTMRVTSAAHLAIDVEMCAILLQLRIREKQLAAKAAEAKLLEESIFRASQDIIDAIKSRRSDLAKLEQDTDLTIKDLRRVVEEVDEDDAIQWASKKIQFYLSEDTNTNELMWSLRQLEQEWEEVRAKAGQVEDGSGGGRGWFSWLW